MRTDLGREHGEGQCLSGETERGRRRARGAYIPKSDDRSTTSREHSIAAHLNAAVAPQGRSWNRGTGWRSRSRSVWDLSFRGLEPVRLGVFRSRPSEAGAERAEPTSREASTIPCWYFAKVSSERPPAFPSVLALGHAPSIPRPRPGLSRSSHRSGRACPWTGRPRSRRKVGFGTNPIGGGTPNPLGFGIGGRAGLSIVGLCGVSPH